MKTTAFFLVMLLSGLDIVDAKSTTEPVSHHQTTNNLLLWRDSHERQTP